ncbi:DUF2383 domain-containing protein [Acetivibrio cellulolyticus]|uniref:DUF2383 domain-containing protein n=1 Tax=Acetivibrio cellulolyticus TaxID=35830 RepID=UPI0001E305BF|nr:DUF2383 domain-containing protein [Acetivibrio cellulolyticus]
MENAVVNELNTVLKGTLMAVESYDKYINELEDKKIKDELKKIQGDHKEHANLLENRIKELGGKPNEKLGVAGAMASAKIAIQNIGNTKAVDILKRAYDGEDKGISMTEEIIKGDLDDKSMKLVSDILSMDHGHLKRMNTLIVEQGKM